MSNNFNNLILRQINSSDDNSKLSLGNADHLPLKTFLKKNALHFHQYEIAKTYVLVNENLTLSRIWGYITLMNSEIVLNEDQRPQETTATLRYEAFPAVKIARLAIDKNLQGKGYGKMILGWCVNHIKLTVMANVGCRFLVVDAKRNSVPFYQKSGFTLLNTESNFTDEHPLMFFDLHKSLEKITAHPPSQSPSYPAEYAF